MKNTNKMLVMLASNPDVSYPTFKSFLRECRIKKLVSPKCCRYLRNYCCSPAWVQHRDAQEKIDQELDNHKDKGEAKPVDLDEIWNLMGW